MSPEINLCPCLFKSRAEHVNALMQYSKIALEDLSHDDLHLICFFKYLKLINTLMLDDADDEWNSIRAVMGRSY